MEKNSSTIPNPSEGPASRNPHQRGLLYQLGITIGVAFILATLFTAWTPGQSSQNSLNNQSTIIAYNPTPTSPIPELVPSTTPESPSVIGIVAGHWKHDSGAVCPNALQEVDINLNIASMVQKYLVEEGYQVDLLSEFDERLYDYKARVLVSIHADSCNYINNQATGYKVAPAFAMDNHPERAAKLTSCLRQRYGQATGLPVHSTSVTPDMTSYHAFAEINDETPAAIIETGFMNLDIELLTQHPEIAAKGITDGILCYIRNESITPLTSSPIPAQPTTLPPTPSIDSQ
jgi:N-acetylmuramoyl-L-alanine amidase